MFNCPVWFSFYLVACLLGFAVLCTGNQSLRRWNRFNRIQHEPEYDKSQVINRGYKKIWYTTSCHTKKSKPCVGGSVSSSGMKKYTSDPQVDELFEPAPPHWSLTSVGMSLLMWMSDGEKQRNEIQSLQILEILPLNNLLTKWQIAAYFTFMKSARPLSVI